MSDLISREWLKTAIHNFYYGLNHIPAEEDIQAYIDAAPSVSTEKTGRWEKAHDEYSYWYKCSCCGEKIPKNIFGSDYFSPYCPECGCKMMEVEE